MEIFDYYYPIQETIVTGPTITPSRHWSSQDAVDLGQNRSVPSGTIPIYSIADGIVLRSVKNWSGGTSGEASYGNYLKIKITQKCALKGATVIYAHMYTNPNQPIKDEVVKKGQIIGYVGTTGNSTGNHLHIEIKDSNNAIIPYQEVAIPNTELRATDFRGGATDYLFRCVLPKFKEAQSSDIRIVCTMAILEAQSLGLIGMEEAVAVAYNRLKFWGYNSMYDVISDDNQFTTYSNNKSLFNSGGYLQNKIPTELWEFTNKLLSGQISLVSSEGWAAGFNNKISKAFYFNSAGPYKTGNLYSRQVNNSVHYYGDSTTGGII